MIDESNSTHKLQPRPDNLLRLLAIAALVCGLGALVWAAVLQHHIGNAEASLVTAQQVNAALQQRLAGSEARSRATSEMLAQRLGTTQAQLDAKTQIILAKQQADAARLANSQQAAEKRIDADVSSVRTDVGSVKTDVGGVKTDVASTKADLADTKTQLQRTMGDAGVMSGLIARNHDELEQLKHRGDRTYIEFNLQKNAPPTLLSTIKLQLKKVDVKKGRYTLTVNADDRLIEKKDKTADEPVQFYSGKTPALFEIVVNNVAKNTVSGYLSVPKGFCRPYRAVILKRSEGSRGCLLTDPWA